MKRGGLTGGAARLAAALAGAATISIAFAQTVPLPPTIDPGRIQERLEPPRVPRPAEIPELKGPEREPPDALKAVRVTLKSIRLEGASAPLAAQLQAQADRYVGREIRSARSSSWRAR